MQNTGYLYENHERQVNWWLQIQNILKCGAYKLKESINYCVLQKIFTVFGPKIGAFISSI